MAVVQMERSVGSRYHQNSNYSKSDVKFRQRALILRFFEKYFPEHMTRPHVLTLPGKEWLFEQMLLERWPEATLLGVERSGAVHNVSRSYIPRNALAYLNYHDNVQDRTFQYGTAQIQYSRISNGLDVLGEAKRPSARRRSNRLLLMDVNDFLTLPMDDYKATAEQKRGFLKKFYLKHAVWLDYTGTLNDKVLRALSCLQFCLSNNPVEKPVAITVLNGRDRYKSKEARVAAIQAAQPGLTIRRVWTYEGANGSSMLTVCGTMI